MSGQQQLDQYNRAVLSGVAPNTGTTMPAIQMDTPSTDSGAQGTGLVYAPQMVSLTTPTASRGHVIIDANTIATYGATITGLVPAASATDIFTLTGAANKVLRIMRIVIACTTTAATGATLDVVFLKRSTANSAGTATQPTIVPFDSADAAASGVVNAYTANPTTGNLVGNFFATKIQQALATPTATDFPTLQPLIMQFGLTDSKPPVLRAATEVFAINLAAQSVAAGALWDIAIEWSEASS